MTVNSRAAYNREATDLALRALGTVAAALGDYLAEIVVVGGVVPLLLIDQTPGPANPDPHLGTLDLDIALAVSFVGSGAYENLPQLLRGAGFAPDKPTLWRWRHQTHTSVAIDLLFKADSAEASGKTKWLVQDELAALMNRFMPLAHVGPRQVSLVGRFDLNGTLCREVTVSVCAPASFLALKAFALNQRQKAKDAYDLFYMLNGYETGISALAQEYAALLQNPQLAVRSLAREGFELLSQHYREPRSPGPAEYALFMGATGEVAAEHRADAWGLGSQFVTEVLRGPTSGERS